MSSIAALHLSHQSPLDVARGHVAEQAEDRLRYTFPMPPLEARSRVIPANEYRRVRWANGLGWTREIHAARVDCADPDVAPGEDAAWWDWRLSIAEIERDARFSTFPGIKRELVLLRGNGLRLQFDDGDTHTLQQPFERLRFDGDSGVVGELLDGPTHDFNLMWRPSCMSVELLHRPLVGQMLFFAQPGEGWALHLLSGQAIFDAACGLPAMAAGDTALLREPSRTRFLLDGGGELLAVRMRSAG